MIFDPTYMIMSIILMALMGLAGRNVQATFKRYSTVPVRRRINGAQSARTILDANGLQDVGIERVAGELTDHYDPRDRVLRLSQPVYDSTSISAVGVAAHEAGHALQHKNGYAPLKLRQGLYPLASMGSNLGMLMIMGGLILGYMSSAAFSFAYLGLLLYAMGVVFTLITLPVEFNASNRALAQLTQYGIVASDEYTSTRKVLNAAALTYVAAALVAIFELLYWAMLVFGGSRDE